MNNESVVLHHHRENFTLTKPLSSKGEIQVKQFESMEKLNEVANEYPDDISSKIIYNGYAECHEWGSKTPGSKGGRTIPGLPTFTLKGCPEKPEFQFAFFACFYDVVMKHLTWNKSIKNKMFSPQSLSERPGIKEEIPECFTAGAKKITMRGGEVLRGYTKGASLEDSTITLQLLGTTISIEVYLQAVLECKSISSKLRGFLGIKPGDFPLLNLNGTLYDPFDDDLDFDKWIDLFIEYIKEGGSLADRNIITLFQLCLDTEIDRFEEELDMEKHPQAAELYFNAGHYDRLMLWDHIEDSIRIPEAVRLFPQNVLTAKNLLLLCEMFKYLGIIGSHPEMTRLYVDIAYICERISKQKDIHLPNILILGDAGSGKELFAWAIHKMSNRHGYFERLNCANFPEYLLESELFGAQKGAHSTADRDRKGIVERCENGTLQLDEIAKLSSSQQPKILRLLEEREFRALGGEKTRKANVLFIASTNSDLGKLVEAGDFAGDLWQRLKGEVLQVPSLRCRLEDTPLLVHYFLQQLEERSPHQLDQYRLPIALWCAKKVKDDSLSVRELRQLLEGLANRSLQLEKVWENNLLSLDLQMGQAIVSAQKDGLKKPIAKAQIAKRLGCHPSYLSAKDSKWMPIIEIYIKKGWVRGK